MSIADQLLRIYEAKKSWVEKLQSLGSSVTINDSFSSIINEINSAPEPEDTSALEEAYLNKSMTSVSNSKVSDIRAYLFYQFTSLTSVDLPNATTIGLYSFQYCTALKSVTLGNFTRIYQYAFQNCSSLKKLWIPSSCIAITHKSNNPWDSPFLGCTSLTIYTEHKSKPSGWDSNWDARTISGTTSPTVSSRIPVVYGATYQTYLNA